MSTQNKKYFCYEIFKNLAIWSFNGKLSYNPCSFYSGYIKSSDQFDLTEVWNSDEHQKIKDLVMNDTPVEGCSTCYQAEERGLESRRNGSKLLYEMHFQDTNIDLEGPQSIDYSVGNLCNLKCIICGPNNSTSWISDYQTIYPNKDISNFKFDKFNQIEITDTKLLKNIINVHFHGGGEPLLSNNHINLLKKIKEVKGLSDVHVFYNTNGTVQASDELLSLWAECKLVELYFSIDDVGPRFDYQRTGASWDILIDNLNWYKENMSVNHMFKINCTWGYLNLYYLDELVDWYDAEFCATRLGDPINLIFQNAIGKCAVNSLPANIITILTKKFEKYPSLLGLLKSIPVDNTQNHNTFWNYIQKIDNLRKNNFSDVCPEWSNLLKQ